MTPSMSVSANSELLITQESRHLLVYLHQTPPHQVCESPFFSLLRLLRVVLPVGDERHWLERCVWKEEKVLRSASVLCSVSVGPRRVSDSFITPAHIDVSVSDTGSDLNMTKARCSQQFGGSLVQMLKAEVQSLRKRSRNKGVHFR